MTRLTMALVALVIAGSLVSAPASAAVADRGWTKTWAGGSAKARANSHIMILGVAF